MLILIGAILTGLLISILRKLSKIEDLMDSFVNTSRDTKSYFSGIPNSLDDIKSYSRKTHELQIQISKDFNTKEDIKHISVLLEEYIGSKKVQKDILEEERLKNKNKNEEDKKILDNNLKKKEIQDKINEIKNEIKDCEQKHSKFLSQSETSYLSDNEKEGWLTKANEIKDKIHNLHSKLKILEQELILLN